MRRKVGVYYHARPAPAEFAAALTEQLAGAVEHVWSCAAHDESEAEQLPGTDLIICVGGDGTVLRAARLAAPHGVPLLGVNMGRLGFLTELVPAEVSDRLVEILSDGGRIEERSMLVARVQGTAYDGEYHALNDVVIGRRSIGRAVYVEVDVDGERFTAYSADAVVVASATGSTGYNLSAGGPILHPESREIVLTPVAPHLSMSRSVVLPADAEIALVSRTNQASLSIDGQEDIDLVEGARIAVRRGPHVARFLRLSPPQHFYAVVGKHLRSATGAANDGESPPVNHAP